MTKRRKAWARSAPTWPQNTIQAPTRKFSKQWPEPQRFPQFLDKTGKMMAVSFNWSADIKTLPNAGDAGFLPVTTRSRRAHPEFFGTIGGGVKETGWQNTQLSKARLAIVLGYSHYNFVSAPELTPIH